MHERVDSQRRSVVADWLTRPGRLGTTAAALLMGSFVILPVLGAGWAMRHVHRLVDDTGTSHLSNMTAQLVEICQHSDLASIEREIQRTMQMVHVESVLLLDPEGAILAGGPPGLQADVLAADPRIVPEARTIAGITYEELRELAYMGAKVLHEEAVFPVRERGIPINIRNTDRPEDAGTLIVEDRDAGDQIVVGIAGRPGFTVFTLQKPMMNAEVGFGRRVLDVLERYGISYEHTPTGIDTMSVVVADEYLQDGRATQIAEELKATLHPHRVALIPGMALVATVGKGMNHHVGVAARLFGALATAGVNVRMIDQGSTEQNIIVGIDDGDLPKAIRAVYDAFAG
ncbi:MAG: ACT domain-containing protein [Planctomycetota bacterium]